MANANPNGIEGEGEVDLKHIGDLVNRVLLLKVTQDGGHVYGDLHPDHVTYFWDNQLDLDVDAPLGVWQVNDYTFVVELSDARDWKEIQKEAPRSKAFATHRHATILIEAVEPEMFARYQTKKKENAAHQRQKMQEQRAALKDRQEAETREKQAKRAKQKEAWETVLNRAEERKQPLQKQKLKAVDLYPDPELDELLKRVKQAARDAIQDAQATIPVPFGDDLDVTGHLEGFTDDVQSRVDLVMESQRQRILQDYQEIKDKERREEEVARKKIADELLNLKIETSIMNDTILSLRMKNNEIQTQMKSQREKLQGKVEVLKNQLVEQGVQRREEDRGKEELLEAERVRNEQTDRQMELNKARQLKMETEITKELMEEKNKTLTLQKELLMQTSEATCGTKLEQMESLWKGMTAQEKEGWWNSEAMATYDEEDEYATTDTRGTQLYTCTQEPVRKQSLSTGNPGRTGVEETDTEGEGLRQRDQRDGGPKSRYFKTSDYPGKNLKEILEQEAQKELQGSSQKTAIPTEPVPRKPVLFPLPRQPVTTGMCM